MRMALIVTATAGLEWLTRIKTAASMLVIMTAKGLTIRDAVEDGESGGERDDKDHKPLQATGSKYGFFRRWLINGFHNSTLHRICTIPQTLGYVNG